MYFIYNGISSEDMKLKIVEFSPPGKAEEKTDVITVPGKPTGITKRLGQYENVKKSAAFVLFDRSMYRPVLEWLSGSGQLIFSDEDDKYYIVHMTGEAEASRICDGVLEFEIKVIFEPFAYAVNNEPITISTSYTEIPNNGTIYSAPVITFDAIASEAPILKGDVDFDGVVDATDASAVSAEYNRILSGEEPQFSDLQNEAADMNDDGEINQQDVVLILNDYAQSQTDDSYSVVAEKYIKIDVNGEILEVGLPSTVVRNGYPVTIDCSVPLLYYTNDEGKHVNIMQYSKGDFPLLKVGVNYVKYSGDANDVKIIVNERWK